jgi:hypothetical protein
MIASPFEEVNLHPFRAKIISAFWSMQNKAMCKDASSQSASKCRNGTIKKKSIYPSHHPALSQKVTL